MPLAKAKAVQAQDTEEAGENAKGNKAYRGVSSSRSFLSFGKNPGKRDQGSGTQ